MFLQVIANLALFASRFGPQEWTLLCIYVLLAGFASLVLLDWIDQ